MLDEPTSALDISVQQQILRLLLRLQREQGLAYLFITHDMAVMGAMAHRIAVMHEGKIVEAGEALALLRHPQQPYTRQLIQASGVTASTRSDGL